jgi:hypothetical protein
VSRAARSMLNRGAAHETAARSHAPRRAGRSWPTQPRDAAQMDEAAKAWQRTASITTDLGERSRCVANGVLCLRYAQGRGAEPSPTDGRTVPSTR